MGVLGASLLLSGCKVELYTGVTQKEGNEMLALLQTEGIASDKQPDKDGRIKLLVEESDVAQAIETLKRKGYPKESFSTLQDVFPKDGLISSPTEERARLTYAKAQEISNTLSEIDGVLVARVHVVLPEGNEGISKKPSGLGLGLYQACGGYPARYLHSADQTTGQQQHRGARLRPDQRGVGALGRCAPEPVDAAQYLAVLH